MGVQVRGQGQVPTPLRGSTAPDHSTLAAHRTLLHLHPHTRLRQVGVERGQRPPARAVAQQRGHAHPFPCVLLHFLDLAPRQACQAGGQNGGREWGAWAYHCYAHGCKQQQSASSQRSDTPLPLAAVPHPWRQSPRGPSAPPPPGCPSPQSAPPAPALPPGARAGPAGGVGRVASTLGLVRAGGTGLGMAGAGTASQCLPRLPAGWHDSPSRPAAACGLP